MIVGASKIEYLLFVHDLIPWLSLEFLDVEQRLVELICLRGYKSPIFSLGLIPLRRDVGNLRKELLDIDGLTAKVVFLHIEYNPVSRR
jgi:hypothetical protein